MAMATAWPTRPGSDCHVPNPTEGILAPVLSWKNRMSSDISRWSEDGLLYRLQRCEKKKKVRVSEAPLLSHLALAVLTLHFVATKIEPKYFYFKKIHIGFEDNIESYVDIYLFLFQKITKPHLNPFAF